MRLRPRPPLHLELVSMKGKRNHKKRHGVNREKSRADRRSHEKRNANDAACLQRRRAVRAAARAYWTGRAADLSEAREMTRSKASMLPRPP